MPKTELHKTAKHPSLPGPVVTNSSTAKSKQKDLADEWPAPLPASAAQDSIPLERRSIRHDLLGTLLTAMFHGEIKAGQTLNIQRLAMRFGVSATPVREALVQLATIGMVEMRHNYGTVARRFGPDELKEIFHLRAILESEATRTACGRLPLDALMALKHEMSDLLNARGEQCSEQARSADRRLHSLIASHCGSRRLEEEIGRYQLLMQCIHDVVGNVCHAQDKDLSEHLNIMDALLNNHSELAAQAMRSHILSTAESVKVALFGDSPPAPETDGQ